MKKGITVFLIMMLSVCLLAGCSKSKDKSGDSDSTGTAESNLDYDPEDYMTLSEYKGLDAYEVDFDATDEEVEEAISDELAENATYEDITDRGAKNEDYVTFDYSATVDGEEVEDCTDTDYEIQLGNEEFDETVEQAMVGKKVGETFSVKATISEDLSSTNGGDDGEFTITIKKIQEESIPELTLSYVTENTDYSTLEEYRAAMKDSVIASKQSDCNEQLYAELLQNVVEASEFKDDYPQELYDTCESQISESIDSTAEMFGMTREDLLTNLYGMTEDDVADEVLNEVHSRLVVYAIAQKESLFLTDSEYDTFAEQYSTDVGYDSVEELESDYGKDLVMYEGVYERVSQFLLENADKTTMTEDEYDNMNAEESDDTSDEESDEETTDDAADDTAEEETLEDGE